MKYTSGDIKVKLFFLEAMYPVREEHENSLLAYKSFVDSNTMYMYEAMKDQNRKQLLKSI